MLVIKEGGLGFLEGNAVLSQILSGLGRIPLKLNRTYIVFTAVLLSSILPADKTIK